MKSLGVLVVAALLAMGEPVAPPAEVTPAPPASVEEMAEPTAPELPPLLLDPEQAFWDEGVQVDPDVRTVTGIGPELDLGVL